MKAKKENNTAIQKVEPGSILKMTERYIRPYVDLYETDGEYVLVADLPGVPRSGLRITITGDQLILDGKAEKTGNENQRVFYSEIRRENYHRDFQLAGNIDRDRIEANLNQGVVTVHLPKREEARAREIRIQ